MNTASLVGLAALVTAFAAISPAEPDAKKDRAGSGHDVIRFGEGWRAAQDDAAPDCWLKGTWKRDYSGKPYLKKVRVCA
jgi:hypothetical protein